MASVQANTIHDDPLESTPVEDLEWLAWYQRQEGEMGQGGPQFHCSQLLLNVLRPWMVSCGWEQSLVGADQFFAWDASDKRRFVSPDVYVLDDPPVPTPDSFQTWLVGHHAPRIAFEIVSQKWKKDYEGVPPLYDELGVQELVVFDPATARQMALPGVDLHWPGTRQPIQVYTRDREGTLGCTYAGPGPVWSAALGVWLVVVSSAEGPLLRIATDSDGIHLVPTPDERAEVDRARAEAAERERDVERERAEVERERAEAERERAEAERERSEALEVELAELRARLAGGLGEG